MDYIPKNVLNAHFHKQNGFNSSSGNGNVQVSSIDNNNFAGDSAVFIRNVCKRYESGPPVLANLCMNVKKGTIYGLLGSSGCGKSTILSLIVGLKKWDSGEILIFGEKPDGENKLGSRLGYMPQDLALYNQLLTSEMIKFYGRLYNMSGKEVANKWEYFSKLLKLPTNKLISDLSGGQKRRISLCLSIMQSPDLLILDEPTVGLDPLVRKGIWNHLYQTVRTRQATIIITTHYTEEARLADTIGFLRKGRLLVEDTPSRLLYNFKCDLLEDVVLHLCRQNKDEFVDGLVSNNKMYQEGNNKVTFTVNRKDQKNPSTYVANHEDLMNVGSFRNASVGFESEIDENLQRKKEANNDDGDDGSLFSNLRQQPLYASLQRIRGLITVLLLTLVRHPLFILMVLLLPTMHGTISLSTIGIKPKDLALGVVNNELRNWSVVCGEESPKQDDIDDDRNSSCDLSTLSCNFLKEINRSELFKLVSVDSENEARQMVQLGQSRGYITIPQNYSEDFIDRLAAKHFAFDESIKGSIINATLDFSESVASLFMTKDLFDAYGGYLHQLAESCNIGGGKEVETPLFFRKPVYGTNDDHYTNFLMPGVMLVGLIGVLSILTSVIFITDRKQGTLSRAKVAGLSTTEVMLSHMITQGLIALAQVALWSLVLFIYFDFVIAGSVWLYLFITLLSGLCGAAMGIFLGIVCEDEVEAMIFGVFWIPILLLFGGVCWPMEAMPKFWQYVGFMLPSTLPVISLRSVIVRGVGLTHGMVYPGVTVLVGWTVVSSICVVITYKKMFK